MANSEKTPDGFVLFKNKFKKEGTNEPDYKGFMHIGEVEFEMGGWIREGAKGKFISGTIKPMSEKGKQFNKSFKPPSEDGSYSGKSKEDLPF